jgi:hypothetical protein
MKMSQKGRHGLNALCHKISTERYRTATEIKDDRWPKLIAVRLAYDAA